MKTRILVFLLLSSTAQTVIGQGSDTFEHLETEILSRLHSGEVVFENDVSDENGATASVLVYVHGPVENIWSVIISCKQAAIFVDGLEFCSVLEERGDYALTRQVVDKGWASPEIDFTFETHRRPYQSMNFKLIKGNIKSMRGAWEFKPLEDGVLVRHMLVLRPLFPAPRWLVRRIMKKDLPDMMRCIRALADGSGSKAAIEADLKSCPKRKR